MKQQLAIISLTVLLLSPGIHASDDVGKAIEYRQGVMNVLSWNTKAIGSMLKGNTDYDAESIKTHAADINRAASLDILSGFPEDSTDPDSAAMDEIWMDFDNFKQKLADFRSAAASLDQTAQTGDKGAVGKAMKDLGASCKGCHKTFKN